MWRNVFLLFLGVRIRASIPVYLYENSPGYVNDSYLPVQILFMRLGLFRKWSHTMTLTILHESASALYFNLNFNWIDFTPLIKLFCNLICMPISKFSLKNVFAIPFTVTSTGWKWLVMLFGAYIETILYLFKTDLYLSVFHHLKTLKIQRTFWSVFSPSSFRFHSI